MPEFNDEWAEKEHKRLIQKAADEDTFTPEGINVKRYYWEIQAAKKASAAPVEEQPDSGFHQPLCECGEKPADECEKECSKKEEEPKEEPKEETPAEETPAEEVTEVTDEEEKSEEPAEEEVPAEEPKAEEPEAPKPAAKPRAKKPAAKKD